MTNPHNITFKFLEKTAIIVSHPPPPYLFLKSHSGNQMKKHGTQIQITWGKISRVLISSFAALKELFNNLEPQFLFVKWE